MRDRDIRRALRERLEAEHQDSETRILSELGLCQGRARVDIAVVNGALSGYEIKSAHDTLQRLDGQAAVYAKSLDHVTLVASSGHVEAAADRVPNWWGIVRVIECDGGVCFSQVRMAQRNPQVDPYAVAQLLWREEALGLLKQLGLQRGLASKPRKAIWARLVESLPADEVRRHVRERLRSRSNWRAA